MDPIYKFCSKKKLYKITILPHFHRKRNGSNPTQRSFVSSLQILRSYCCRLSFVDLIFDSFFLCFQFRPSATLFLICMRLYLCLSIIISRYTILSILIWTFSNTFPYLCMRLYLCLSILITRYTILSILIWIFWNTFPYICMRLYLCLSIIITRYRILSILIWIFYYGIFYQFWSSCIISFTFSFSFLIIRDIISFS